jgi:hypothetical protein
LAALSELCEITSAHKIRKVTIARSNLQDTAALALARFLSEDRSADLEVLMLDGNDGIGDEGAADLGRMLSSNRTLLGATLPPSPLSTVFFLIRTGSPDVAVAGVCADDGLLTPPPPGTCRTQPVGHVHHGPGRGCAGRGPAGQRDAALPVAGRVRGHNGRGRRSAAGRAAGQPSPAAARPRVHAGGGGFASGVIRIPAFEFTLHSISPVPLSLLPSFTHNLSFVEINWTDLQRQPDFFGCSSGGRIFF